MGLLVLRVGHVSRVWKPYKIKTSHRGAFTTCVERAYGIGERLWQLTKGQMTDQVTFYPAICCITVIKANRQGGSAGCPR